MPNPTPISPVCLECEACGPGCPEAAAALPLAKREAMQRVQVDLLGHPPSPIPRQCWHCAQAPCIEVCPAGAMRRDAAPGSVWVDRSRCVGCWMCVLACPFGAVLPSSNGQFAVKCDGCRGREVPKCLGSCRPRDDLFVPMSRAESVRQRRAALAVAGWGWPGPADYPPPQTSPRSIPPPPVKLEPHRCLVVGSGIAAVRAVETLRAASTGCEITLVSDEWTPPYSRVLLSHHIAGLKDEQSVALRTTSWLREMEVELIAGDGAAGLDADRRQVTLRSGRTLSYNRLLIATGASPVRLPVPGAKLGGVVGLRHLRDAAAIRSLEPREVVIVGGGFVGIKAAEALRQLGARVTMVEKLEQLLPRVLDAPAAKFVQEAMEAHGVRILTGVGVREIEGRDRATGVLLESGERVRADLIVVAVGVAPNIHWLRGSPVRVRRGVVVNERMRTNIPEVWAAGDVAESRDMLTGERTVSGLWPVAAAQGRVAGANMAGSFESYPGSISMNTLDVFGLAVASFGQVRGDSERVIEQNPGRYQKRVYRNGALVGAVLAGDIREAGKLLAEVLRQDLHPASHSDGPPRRHEGTKPNP